MLIDHGTLTLKDSSTQDIPWVTGKHIVQKEGERNENEFCCKSQ